MKKWAFIFLFLGQGVMAQDVHFSQWYNNPLFSNPAFTSYFDGDYRITAHQREQWASVSIPFSTTSVGLDMPLNNWGVGAQILRDQSGSSRLSQTQLNLSVARSLDDWRIGFQIGFAQRSIDYSDLIFIDNGETISSQTKNYLDMGFGVNRALELNAGQMNVAYGLFHFNTPNRSFISVEDKLALRHQFSSVFDYYLSKQWQLSPSVNLALQQKQREWMLGSLIRFDMSEYYYKSIHLEAGAYYRFGDALTCLLGFQYEQSHLGFSYDWNTSDLVPASNSLGAWEISLSHIINSSILSKPKYKTCPAFL